MVSNDLLQALNKKLQFKICNLVLGLYKGIGADSQNSYRDNGFLTFANKNLFL